MYTRCPECDTLFRVTARQLQLAHGQVRCGSCATSFDALASLSDELPGDGPVAAQDEPEAGIPALQAADPEAGLEFDAPESTWGQFFIEAPRPAPPVDEAAPVVPLDDATGGAEEWQALLEEIDEDGEPGQAGASAEEPAGPVFVLGDEPARRPRPAEAHGRDDPAPAPAAAGPAGDDADQTDELAAGFDPTPPWAATAAVRAAGAGNEAPVTRRTALALAALGALLALQLLHYNRDALAADPRVGPMVRRAYESLGLTLYPQWNLDAFAVRRAEALAGGSAPDALDISALVEVAGGETTGLPMVRVVLRDQWMNTVASGVFAPDDYLPEALPPVVTGGTRIPVRLSVRDPGVEARGYVLDICLPRRDRGLECQLRRDPFQQ